MIFHRMIFFGCTMHIFLIIKLCITWFLANMIFFSCHKNHIRLGIAIPTSFKISKIGFFLIGIYLPKYEIIWLQPQIWIYKVGMLVKIYLVIAETLTKCYSRDPYFARIQTPAVLKIPKCVWAKNLQ